jgi:hypothetical protein
MENRVSAEGLCVLSRIVAISIATMMVDSLARGQPSQSNAMTQPIVVKTDANAAIDVQNTRAGGFGIVTMGNGGIVAVGTGKKGVGVQGESSDSFGVSGISEAYIGVNGSCGPGEVSPFVRQHGVATDAANCIGVRGQTKTISGRGVEGNGVKYGVVGIASGHDGQGVAGKSQSGALGAGVYGESATGFAGFFRGRVTITDSLIVSKIFATEISGGKKLFRIDDPVDPSNRYLSHTSVESDEMTTFYSGTITIDQHGTAWVALPRWFEALNKDFRYQLTCVGGFAPVYIAQEIKNNRFEIAGGTPGLKVSWQVTGLRHDA